MSEEAIRQGLAGKKVKRPHGMVVGFGQGAKLVIVGRDGLKGRETYHMDFWERQNQDLGE